MTLSGNPAVTANQVARTVPVEGENLTRKAGAKVQDYSLAQETQIQRLAPIRYCTLPEFYLEEALNVYLPRSPVETEQGHQDRQSRAQSSFEPFYPYLRNLTVGSALRKGVAYPEGEPWDSFFKDVDLEGTSLTSYTKKAFTAALDGGIAGFWCDYPDVDPDLTLAEEKKLALRPYWVVINCEDILELRAQIRSIELNGVSTLRMFPVYLRLRATYSPSLSGEDPSYYLAEYPAVREYRLVVDENGNTVVKWTLFAMINKDVGMNDNSESDYEEVDGGYIRKPYIPFVPCYGGEIEQYGRARPALLDTARLNLHHWVIAANLANNIHNTAFDRMYGTGISDDEELNLESDKLLTARQPDARFGILSPEMKGADAALQNLARIEKSMENLAAVAMTSAKPQAESGYSKLIDRAQSDSQLVALVRLLEDSLNLLISYTADWMGEGVDPVQVSISKEFVPVKMHSQQVMALLNLWEKTPMPIGILFRVFESGMMFEGIPDFSVEKMLKEIGLTGSETYADIVAQNPALASSIATRVSAEAGAPSEGEESGAEAREDSFADING